MRGPEHLDYKEWVQEMQSETSILGVSDAVPSRYRGKISSIMLCI